MENERQIRVIGNASKDTKEEARKRLNEHLNHHASSLPIHIMEQLRGHDRPKSEKEIALINFANKITSELMVEVGVEPFDIPLNNFHIVPSELYRKIKSRFNDGDVAVTEFLRQAIILDDNHFRNNILSFGMSVIHEMLHLKAYLAIQVEGDINLKTISTYRAGVSALSTQKELEHSHFDGLHEAIVSELEKRLYVKILDLPELAEEKEWLNSQEAIQIKQEISEKEKIPLDDFEWIDKNGKKFTTFSYEHQRAVLSYVCDEILKQFPDQYKNTYEVFKEFVKAHFTGNLLTIAKLVEKTFGEFTFRDLGNMLTIPESAVLCLETLQKRRWRQLNPKETPIGNMGGNWA